jgi:D-alanyl-D-alanine carboxypeptidase
LFEPGASERYSNGGYVVLGAIIEKISGQDYYTYVRQHIFVLAGMNSSDSFEADVPTPNVASGYSREEGGSGKAGPWRNNMYTRPARGSSAGGGYSTVADLYRFSQALQSGKLLSAASMARFFPQLTQTPAGPGPAPGMGVAGGAPGINAALEIDPNSKTTVVVMANLDPPAAGNIARTITRFLRNIRD